MGPKRHARVRIADYDSTNLVSLAPSNPADIVGILPIVRDVATRNVLADFQQFPESRGCPSIVAFLIRVQVPKEHASSRGDQPQSRGNEVEGRGRGNSLTDVLCRVGGSTRMLGA